MVTTTDPLAALVERLRAKSKAAEMSDFMYGEPVVMRLLAIVEEQQRALLRVSTPHGVGPARLRFVEQALARVQALAAGACPQCGGSGEVAQTPGMGADGPTECACVLAAGAEEKEGE